MKRLLSVCPLALLVGLFSTPHLTLAQTPTLKFPNPLVHPFGQHVLHEEGWDRYLMYFSANSAVRAGKPVGDASPSNPGDEETYNSTCSTWWADRIWLTWSYGDGINPAGWNEPDDYGNTPPFLLLGIGGQDRNGDGEVTVSNPQVDYLGVGERALIGDPYVVNWNNKWHMYYEGTDLCNANSNEIFHATADSWFGPWTKKGKVTGLRGSHANTGFSWPTVRMENGNLYLYYTDGNVHLLAAQNSDSTGQNFTPLNWNSSLPESFTNPTPVIAQQTNRGHVVKTDLGYKLVYDVFTGSTVQEIRSAFSSNPLSFPAGTMLFLANSAYMGWAEAGLGLPTFLKVGTEERVYFTGHTYAAPGWPGWEVSQIGVGILGSQVERLTNGGFETITATTNTAPDGSWTRTSYTGVSSNALQANTTFPRSGADYARLGVSNSSSQRLDHSALFIPANATSATLSFWLAVATADVGPTVTDTLNVDIVNAATGAVLGTVMTLNNLANPNGGYFLKAVDVTAFRNKSIKVRFRAANNSTNATLFRIDDVSLKSDG